MYHNKPKLTNNRKRLRTHSTSAKAIFWTMIKSKQLGGLKFKRQHSIGNYILDFYCPEIHLAIELDREYHIFYQEKDEKRDDYLKSLNIGVIRYENKMIFEYPDQITQDILNFQNTVT